MRWWLSYPGTRVSRGWPGRGGRTWSGPAPPSLPSHRSCWGWGASTLSHYWSLSGFWFLLQNYVCARYQYLLPMCGQWVSSPNPRHCCLFRDGIRGLRQRGPCTCCSVCLAMKLNVWILYIYNKLNAYRQHSTKSLSKNTNIIDRTKYWRTQKYQSPITFIHSVAWHLQKKNKRNWMESNWIDLYLLHVKALPSTIRLPWRSCSGWKY